MCALLQETMLGNSTPFPPAGYDIHTHSLLGRPVPGDGLAVLIKRGIPFRQIPLQTELYAMAFQIRLSKMYTICNLYIPPNSPVTSDQITNLISQLPTPYILGGDLNGKHQMWGNGFADRQGYIVEDTLVRNYSVLLNTGSNTHLHVQTGTSSAIDLTICSPWPNWT